ncbi:hypothetical protein L6452_19042 [Arctium lappa]|uniref:Uncharacterized protein n=1 Tax=Arctium lappa TaxID=4217 RepID=A0ACB9B8B0_ARCLA|nr:hypothetical protein L6452_19042 [Arctium lappa]
MKISENFFSSSFRCNFSFASKLEPHPVFTSVTSFAPATVANLGPGFDFLGCAVDDIGNSVTVTIDPDVQPSRISIAEITGVDNSSKKLSKNPLWNCAAISVMKMLNIRSVGLSLSMKSGLGSSAASAAAAVAVNEIFGGKLQESDLVVAGLEAEAKVSGYHADNIAPAIMGGGIRDVIGIGKAVSSDKMVEPLRAPLIPGMEAVKKAAMEAGACGCTISGAGPSVVVVTNDEEKGWEIGEKMVEAFMERGKLIHNHPPLGFATSETPLKKE